MAKAIIDFTQLTGTGLDQQAEKTLNKMTGNALFAELRPELSVLETDLADYHIAVKRDRSAHLYRFEYRLAGTPEWTWLQARRRPLIVFIEPGKSITKIALMLFYLKKPPRFFTAKNRFHSKKGH